MGGDLGGHDRRATAFARLVEAVDPFLAILRDAAQETILGDPEGANDLCLGTRPLATELRREHAKGLPVVVGVLEDRLDAAEVGPLLVLTDHADQVIDRGGTVGDQRQ